MNRDVLKDGLAAPRAVLRPASDEELLPQCCHAERETTKTGGTRWETLAG